MKIGENLDKLEKFVFREEIDESAATSQNERQILKTFKEKDKC